MTWINKSIAILGWALFAQPATAGDVQTETRAMSFEDCQRLIQITASQMGQAPINIAETPILRMVRFLTSDGSVLVTCSKPDGKVAITQSKP